MVKLIVVALLLGVYAVGFRKFWKGFKLTNFEPTMTNRLMLSALWPVLLVSNKSYRKNFQKALRGR